jgi:hypothetical protein
LSGPSSRIKAGRSRALMRVASRTRATAMPTPRSLRRATPEVAKAMNTMASSAAAVVTIHPVRSKPIATAAVVSPSTPYSSRIRLSKKT